MQRKQLIFGLIFQFVIVELITYSSLKSLNPFAVYEQSGLAIKILVSIFLGLMGLTLLQIIASKAIGERVCSACGLDIMRYAMARGNPMKCNFCGRWYHAQCFKAKGGTIFGGCGCQSAPMSNFQNPFNT